MVDQSASPRGSSALPARRDRLALDIHRLATEIGPRNVYHYESLCQAAQYIETAFREAGYVPKRQTFVARGNSFCNIIAEQPGTDGTGESFVVGAHYDTHKASP